MPGLPRDLRAFLNRWPRRLATVACLLLAGASALPARQPSAAQTASTASTAAADTAVVLARRPIAAGRDLTSADVTLTRWPRRLIPVGATTRLAQVIGHRVGSAVARGEPITGVRLVGVDLAGALPVGQLAVPVTLTDPGAAALVRPGDRVDLLAGPAGTEQIDTGSGSATGSSPAAEPTGATTAALGVRVLAVLPSSGSPGGTTSTELIVAADRASALRVAALAGRPMVAVRDDHP